MKRNISPLIPYALCLIPFISAFTWGFFAHKKLNQLAVFTLPPEMVTFYKKNIDYLTKHSTDPDSRRYAVEGEAVKHYIDLDHYGAAPFDSIPKKWKAAVEKYSEDTLRAYGTVPWQVEKMVYSLTDAFKEMNIDRILYLSANIGHYIADAHVPLHTTENYNGQMTNQIGIHGFLESRLPELFSDQYDLFTGRADYIKDVNEEIWKIIKESYSAKDTVLKFESELSAVWSSDKKYSHEGTKKVYSQEYSEAYNKKLNGLVKRRMRKAIHSIGSFWYTAWVNAGKPDINSLISNEVADSIKTAKEATEELWKSGKLPKGHGED
jgi:hypothetical protein